MAEDGACIFRGICYAYIREYNSPPILKEDFRQFCDNLPQDLPEEGFCPMYDILIGALPYFLSKLTEEIEEDFKKLPPIFEKLQERTEGIREGQPKK